MKHVCAVICPDCGVQNIPAKTKRQMSCEVCGACPGKCTCPSCGKPVDRDSIYRREVDDYTATELGY